MRRRHLASLILFLMSALAQPGLALAAQPTVQIDDTRLTKLYESYISRNQNDAYLAKRIEEERANIRSQINDELQAYVDTNSDSDTIASNLPKALDRQRTLVSGLQQNLRERQVDLTLLIEEEQHYYASSAGSTSASGTPPPADDFRTTQSEPQLLAKKAILEERIAALQSLLPVQQDKLQRLNQSQILDQYAFFITIATYIGILLIVIFVERSIQTIVISRISNRNRRYALKKVVAAAIYIFAAIWVLSRLVSEYPTILASLAIIGAGLAVALQDLVKDVVAWLVIIQKRNISLEDRITVGDKTGDVIDIGVLRTTLMEVGIPGQSDALERTGRTMYIPNALILTQAVVNSHTTSDFTKAEMQLTITYESDWKKAEKLLRDILTDETREYTKQARKQHSKRTHLLYIMGDLTDAELYHELATSGVMFTLRFNVPIGMRRNVISVITSRILEEFGKNQDLHLAYNTVRSFSSTVVTPKGWPEGRA